MNAIDLLEALESTSSRKAKEQIVAQADDNLKKLFVWAMDPQRTYGLQNIPAPDGSGLDNNPFEYHVELLDDLLRDLSDRVLVGGEARAVVSDFLSALPPLTAKWFHRVILKDLDCGVTAKTVNKIFADLVPIFTVQLASELKPHELDKITTFPVWVDYKMDGNRCVAIKEYGIVTLWSRGGFQITTLPGIVKALHNMPDDMVLDGEAMGSAWNDSQSIIWSRVNKKSDDDVFYNVFDAMPLSQWKTRDCPLPYTIRRELAKQALEAVSNPQVRLIGGRLAKNVAAIKTFLEEALKLGYEGIMVKNLDGPYVFGRGKEVIKVKPFSTWEGTITGWNHGDMNSKWAGHFGSFNIKVGEAVTNVGGGFTDALRNEIWQNLQTNPDYYSGKIAEVKGKELTPDGQIREPVFLRFRDLRDV